MNCNRIWMLLLLVWLLVGDFVLKGSGAATVGEELNCGVTGVDELAFSEFRDACLNPKKGQRTFRVRLKFQTDDHNWHECEARNSRLVLQDNLEQEVTEEIVADFYYNDNAWLVGGKTIREAYDRMSDDDRWEWDHESPFIIREKPIDVDVARLEDAIMHNDPNEVRRIIENRNELLEAEVVMMPPELGGLRIGKPYCYTSPLVVAATLDSVEVLTMLLDLGADPYRVVKYGARDCVAAAVRYSPEGLNALLKVLEPSRIQSHRAVTMAINLQDYNTCKRLLDFGFKPTFVDGRGSCLHQLQSPEAFRLLESYGLDLNLRNKNGNTPLHSALINSHLARDFNHPCWELAKLFVERGADISIKNSDDKTPVELLEDATNRAAAEELRQIASRRKGAPQ